MQLLFLDESGRLDQGGLFALQCADLVVAATVAAERGIGLASGYLKKLRPRFAVHPATGEIAGVGLKRFPEAGDRAREHHRLF
jgi:hypothetical protein